MIEETKKSTLQKQLAEARKSLSASGKSPYAIGQESKQKVLEWIYRWGYTSSSVVQQLLCKTSGGYAHRLSKQGWLTETITESITSSAFYTLSIKGLQEAEHRTLKLYRYVELDPYRINQHLLRHNLTAQILTVNALHTKFIESYETERMILQDGDQTGIKHPDVVWLSDKLRWGIEIELTAKWSRDLDDFVMGIINVLDSTEKKPALYSRFILISDSPAILSRYRQAMHPGEKLNIWKKNQRNYWVIDNTIAVPNWLSSKVDFQLIER